MAKKAGESTGPLGATSLDRALQSPGALEFLSEVAKALGHPIRLQILRYLLQKNQCFCGDFVRAFPKAQSTISQHLKVLKGAGMIEGEPVGASSNLCVNLKALKRFKALIASL